MVRITIKFDSFEELIRVCEKIRTIPDHLTTSEGILAIGNELRKERERAGSVKRRYPPY